MTQEEKSSAMAKARWNVAQRPEDTSLSPTTKVVLVGSGKGGVGKSSVTVNLAAALAATGLTVGVLDADIWGFSVPRMLGVSGRLAGEERDGKKQMVPHERTVGDGLLRVVSMGFLVEDEEQALMWRGLMLNRGVSTSSRTSPGATTSTTSSSTCPRAPATCRWAWPSCCRAPR